MLRSVSVLLLFAAPATAQFKVWIVDAAGGPGHHYTELQPALDNASFDDTILVRSGVYGDASEGFVIGGATLQVVAEAGAQPLIQGPAIVRNLGPLQTVTLRGLRIEPMPLVFGTSGSPLSITDCEGQVVIEDCELQAVHSIGVNPSGPGLRAVNAADVTITRTTSTGADGLFDCVGLYAESSTIHAWESSLLGGTENVMSFDDTLTQDDGGDGARLIDSALFASGCAIVGADGGDADSLFLCAGDGGDGLVLFGASSAVLLETEPAAGAAGAGTSSMCSQKGDRGDDIVDPLGATSVLGVAARSLEVSSPVRENDPLDIAFHGQPNDFVFALLSIEADPVFLPAFNGTQVPQAPVAILPFGSLGATGSLEFTVATPALAPGLESLTFHTQGAFLGATGDRVLSSPSALVLIQSGL